MPTAVLKALDCKEASDIGSADELRLEVAVDGGTPTTLRRQIDTGERWLLDRELPFGDRVVVELTDEDDVSGDDRIGRVQITAAPRHRATHKLGDGKYVLWYEVVPAGTEPSVFHRPAVLSLRDTLSRFGRGGLDGRTHDALVSEAAIYRCSEVVSSTAALQRHAAQDGGRGRTTSLREWLLHHCNPWGEETPIPVEKTPEAFTSAEIATGAPNWQPVTNERSRRLAGFQHYSRRTAKDNPARHATFDWLADVIPDPEYAYLLDYTSKRVDDDDGGGYPILHNEWESGSLPLEWRPFWGEHVTLEGRHVFDVGHQPVHTELHPMHTIVRQHTTAGPLGDDGELVPVNRAIIGVGASGGFPEQVGDRWQVETGEDPPAWAEEGGVEGCWYTALANHPVSFGLFPPVPRPHPDARLRARVVLCEVIEVADGPEIARFLRHCRNNNPESGGEQLGFRRWDRAEGLPTVAPPRPASPALQPQLTERDGSWFDVSVDLADTDGIAVGYYAIVECGWSRRGPHTLRRYDVTFGELKAHEVSESVTQGEWHLHHGVNGQWAASYLSSVEAGDVISHDRTFDVWVLDDMPLSLRDCGVEHDVWVSEYLGHVEISAPGPDHLTALRDQDGVVDPDPDGDALSFRAFGQRGAGVPITHEWTMRVRRTQIEKPRQ